MRLHPFIAVALAGTLSGCSCQLLQPPDVKPDVCNHPLDAGSFSVAVLHTLTTPTDPAHFYSAPFPQVNRTDYLPGCPRPRPLLRRFVDTIAPHSDYSTSSGIFFGLSAPGVGLPKNFVRPKALRLPDGGQQTVTLEDGGTALEGISGLAELPSVFLFKLGAANGGGVDLKTDGFSLQPIEVAQILIDRSNPCGTDQVVLSVLPVQGRPLDPASIYAAVVTHGLADQPDDAGFVQGLCTGSPPAGLELGDGGLPLYQAAFDVLRSPSFGLACPDIAGITVFRTGDPTREFKRAVEFARSQTPLKLDAPLALDRPDGVDRCGTSRFCTFVGSVAVPTYQRGVPPFAPYFDYSGSDGDDGAWKLTNGVATPNLRLLDDGGVAVATVAARLVVTVPRGPMPPAGFPLVVFTRAGAGGNGDPLVDRGPTQAPTCYQSACQGPAEIYASSGWAGLTMDGPLVGISRGAPLLLQEDLAIFNFLNPPAMRDNVRESGLELALLPKLIESLQISADEAKRCDFLDTTDGPVKFDTSRLVLFGHSMGAAIAPLALAAPPTDGSPYYRAAIYSGSGGSFIENIIYKREPVPIAAGGGLVGYTDDCAPSEADPEMSMIQRALEPADSQVYSTSAIDAGLQLLMIQGIEDHYILPPIADAMTLAEGLDLALSSETCSGAADCDIQPEPNGCVTGTATNQGYPSISTLLPLSNREVIQLPARGNQRRFDGKPVTAVVVQHRPPRIEGCPCQDGHEVAYEVELARHQQECFLRGLDDDGGTQVPATGGLFSACTQ